MQTIVVNSQKGGSGKTSLCAHLSVEAERIGDGPVYLIDTDPQGTLSAWHEARAAEAPRRVEIPIAILFRRWGAGAMACALAGLGSAGAAAQSRHSA